MKQAQQRAAAAAQQVAALKAQLAVAQSRLDAAQTAQTVAAEAFDVAQVQLAAAQDATRTAAAAEAASNHRLQGAQADVGRLAAQTYQQDGVPPALQALLSANGPQDLLERTADVRVLGVQRQLTLRRMDTARAASTQLHRQAAEALLRQQAATAKVAATRARARQQADAAAAVTAAQQQQVQVVLGRLATLQHTSLALEQARAAGLEQARQDALRLARERQARQHPAPGISDPGSGGSTGGGSSGTAQGGLQAVRWAEARIGLPYLWGGAGPDSYDCSGLTMRAWEQAGVYLPHSAAMQYEQGEKISYSQLRPGDLIAYATDTADPASIHHVTLYAGGGMMVEAPHTGAFVRLVPVRYDGSMPYAARP